MANPILTVFENEGLSLLENDQATIEAAASALVDETVQKVATALENALPTTGLAGLIDGQLKGVITAAEPSLESAANAEVDALYSAIETALKNVIASGSTAPAAPAAEAPPKPAE